jgi:hypothetical protein
MPVSAERTKEDRRKTVSAFLARLSPYFQKGKIASFFADRPGEERRRNQKTSFSSNARLFKGTGP